ncbi:collagen-like protein, partial [Methylobacterium sp. WL7]
LFAAALAALLSVSAADGAVRSVGYGQPGPAGQQGIKGDAGAAGPTGQTGAKGDPGATGSQGAQGLVGQTGATGPAGIVPIYGP